MLLKKFFRYTIPSIISMWIFALYTMVDGIFVARGVGKYALAAVNLSMPYTILIFSIGLMLATGACSLISIFLGEGNKERAQNTFNQNMAVLLVIGILLTVFTQLNLERIAVFLGASQDTLAYVKGYMGSISLFAVFFIVSYNMEVLVKADGAPHIQMIGVLSCALTNIILDYIFVMKLHMGVEGAAIATGIAQVISTSFFLLYFKFRGKRLSFAKFRPDFTVYRRIIPIGLSDSITELSGGLVIFLFNHMIVSVIGSQGLVSYTVISYVNTLALNSMAGISQGTQPLNSFYYGAGMKDQYHTLLRYSLIGACVSGAFFLALSELLPGLPVGLFLGKENSSLYGYSVTALRLYGISFAMVGINVVSAGFFSAVERPQFSVVISSARSFAVLSVCLVAMTAAFGEYGIWLSTGVSEFICLFFTAFFFARYKGTCKNGGQKSRELTALPAEESF